MRNNPKKQQIIKAAQRRFIRHGLSKTTMEEIARDLRIGKATVYHYFNSKEEIFFEVINTENDRYLEMISEILSNSSSALEQKLDEYFHFKSKLKENFPLLYELLFLIVNEKSIEKEVEIFRSLVEKEELLINDNLKSDERQNSDSLFPKSVVLQSFSNLFTSILNRQLYGGNNFSSQSEELPDSSSSSSSFSSLKRISS